jgi:hypothetical protein
MWGFINHAVDIASDGMPHVQRFLTISSGAQEILRLLLKNFRGCSVGITEGMDL